jgi:hypothetical protein
MGVMVLLRVSVRSTNLHNACAIPRDRPARHRRTSACRFWRQRDLPIRDCAVAVAVSAPSLRPFLPAHLPAADAAYLLRSVRSVPSAIALADARADARLFLLLAPLNESVRRVHARPTLTRLLCGSHLAMRVRLSSIHGQAGGLLLVAVSPSRRRRERVERRQRALLWPLGTETSGRQRTVQLFRPAGRSRDAPVRWPQLHPVEHSGRKSSPGRQPGVGQGACNVRIYLDKYILYGVY